MIVLAGADLVLPGQVLSGGTLIIDQGRIAAIEPRVVDGPANATRIDLTGQLIVPGFIDVHVHGVAGIDALDGPTAVADDRAAAATLRRHRLLPDVRGLRPRDPDRLPGRRERGTTAGTGSLGEGPRRAPRKQLHQSGMERRSANRLPSPAAVVISAE